MKILILISLFYCPLSLALTSKYYPLVYESYLLEKKGDIPKAISKMTTILKTQSDDYFVNLRLGELFTKDKKIKLAIDHFKKASRLQTEAIDPRFQLSTIAFSEKDWAQVELATEEILKRDSHHLVANIRFLTALIETEKYSKAIERMEEILNHHPLNKELLELKARALQKNGDTVQSKKTLMELILVDPDNILAKSLLSEMKEP